MIQTAPHEASIELLAQRWPLLVQDLSRWTRQVPTSTRVGSRATSEVRITEQDREILFDATSPQSAIDLLDDSEREIVHVFPEVSGFLRFLTSEDAGVCIDNPRWLPLLAMPLQHASHTQNWLAQIPPAQWPWSLAEPARFEGHALAELMNVLGRQMLGVLKEMTGQLAAKLAVRYTDHPAPAQILNADTRKLRVMTIAFSGSSYQQFCARDIAESIESNGHAAQSLILTGGPARDHETLAAICAFEPDVLILNGRSRHDFPGLPAELCVLTWDQDYALSPHPQLRELLGPRDLVMQMVDEWHAEAIDAGVDAKRVAYVNLGTNHRLYHPPRATLECEFDVLFVGNIYPFEQYKQMIGFGSHPQPVQNAMLHARQVLREFVLNQPEDAQFVLPDLDALMRDSLQQTGTRFAGDARQWRYLVNYFRYRVAHLLLRELYIESLSEFNLGLFGRGWEKFPALAKFAHPELENGAPLRDAIHRSAINLHLHTWTVHHPRLYDTAAAGGFLLVGRVPEMHPLEEVFTVGRELDAFGSIAQLKKQIRHYLAHPEDRAVMAARAVERVRRDHTMDQRMGQTLDFLQGSGQ